MQAMCARSCGDHCIDALMMLTASDDERLLGRITSEFSQQYFKSDEHVRPGHDRLGGSQAALKETNRTEHTLALKHER